MSDREPLTALRAELLTELPHILDYWMAHGVEPSTGSFLTLGCDNRPLADGHRSAVLMARDVWAFSAAARLTGDARWADTAKRAFAELCTLYVDPLYGGVYETLDAAGRPLCADKLIYTQSYAIYGCAAYYLLTREPAALELAQSIYQKIERHALDAKSGGYRPVCTRDWSTFEDWVRYPALKGKYVVDTFLHLTESYTELYKAWPDEALAARLQAVSDVLMTRFLRPSGALYQELDTDWQPTDDTSDRFGDESEAAWMLCEAAEQLNRGRERTQKAAIAMMENLCRNGYDTQNGGVYDRRFADGTLSTDKMWWEESESVIGLLYAWRVTGRAEFLQKAMGTWHFIKQHFLNPAGDWYWKTTANGTPVPVRTPADPLKCPYHSTRIVTHVVTLIDRIQEE